MLQAYRSILATPGARSFSAAGALGRLPISMTGLGIVLLVEHRTQSYAAAGLVAAAFIMMSAVCGPIQGTLADRHGQSRVLTIAAGLYTLGIILLLTVGEQSIILSCLSAAIAGTGAPQTGNMVRTRWTHVLSDRQKLSTAFALEAVMDETVFVVGPVLVTFLTLNVLDVSGLAVAAACAMAGGWGLAFQRSTAPPPRVHHAAGAPALPWRRLIPVIIAAVCIGMMFGSSEVLVVAFTDERGQKLFAGWVLAISSMGSLASGLAVGARPSAEDPVKRLRITTLLLFLAFLPIPFVTNIWLLTLGFFLVGLMIAPTLIAAVSLVEHVTPHGRLTEALTWVTTGLSTGVAIGAIASGQIVEISTASWGLVLPLGAAGLAALIAHLNDPGPLSGLVENTR